MKRRVTAGLFAALMAASLMLGSVPAKAAGSYDTTIGGTTTTSFEKYLVMDQNAEVPNATFSFTVSAGTAKAYDVAGKKFQVLSGVDADAVTMKVGTEETKNIVYKQGDTTAQDDNSLVKGYDKSSQKYAQKTATLDFSACKFSEPGVYRYIITETATTNQGITNDEDSTRVLDVYVNDATTEDDGKKLTIAGYVLHSNADDEPDIAMDETNGGSTGAYVATKSQGFTNTYTTQNLTFRNEVSGNQASHDKYFAYTVKITKATVGTVYKVDISKADAKSGTNAATITENQNKDNATTLTVGADGTVTATFYLQHGQEITIQGLAKDTKYEITENAEDYKSTPKGATTAGYDDEVSGTIDSKDIKTSYLNTRAGSIPTGVLMTTAPFAAAVALGGFGILKFAGRKKKEDEEA